MFALAPLEILIFLAFAYGLFRLFCRLLNSKRLSKVINEVAHPEPDSDEDIVQAVEHSIATAERRVADNEAEIGRKKRANDSFRQRYGFSRKP